MYKYITLKDMFFIRGEKKNTKIYLSMSCFWRENYNIM